MIRILAILGVLAIAAPVRAQNVECKKTETQAECHDRLQCKPNEELADCQKRLLKCTADESLDDCKKRHAAAAGQGGDNRGNDRGGDRDDRGNDRGGDRDERGGGRDDRGNNDRDDRGNTDRDDRGRRDDRDDRGRRDDRDDGRRSSGGRRGRSSGRSSFEANKTFGLGLELGEPDGINGKVFLSPAGAIDFGVGYIYDHYYYGDGLHLYADYLWHPVSIASTPSFELPFYVGGGLRFWDFRYCVGNVCDYAGSSIGIRVPLGIAFDFNNVPLDIFLQLVPTLDFVSGDYYTRYGNREHFGIDGSVGIRFWFK